MKKVKNVKFHDKVEIILEPPELSLELQESRKSNFFQRQADHIRYEKLLKPVLENKIKQWKLYTTLV
jgi:hypothetical protein